MMGYQAERKKLTISLAVWIQYTYMSDGETDRKTLADIKYRAYE